MEFIPFAEKLRRFGGKNIFVTGQGNLGRGQRLGMSKACAVAGST
jgi:hypothetical protein